MSAKIVSERYGKSRVRMVKVKRAGKQHDISDVTVEVLLEGEFTTAYTEGDNSKVLPTDTMKNTVYALGKDHPLDTIEAFALHLGKHFVGVAPQIKKSRITIRQTQWGRISVDGAPHQHSFMRKSDEKPWCEVAVAKNGSADVESGIDDLVILKTTESGFSRFLRDQFTTLKDTNDRIFGTSLQARWTYSGSAVKYAEARDAIRRALLETFAQHKSASVQHTLYAMGEAALAACKELATISLRMPNRHCLLVDLAPFGKTNANEIFLPIDEPSGLIEATLKRG